MNVILLISVEMTGLNEGIVSWQFDSFSLSYDFIFIHSALNEKKNLLITSG